MQVIKCRVGQFNRLSLEVPFFVYVGRGFKDFPASPFANPFVVGEYGPLEECLKGYRYWLRAHVVAYTSLA